MVTAICIVLSINRIDGLDLFRIGCCTLILDVFRLLRSSLCICIECIWVVNRVLVCCFLVKGHLVAGFCSGEFAVVGL